MISREPGEQSEERASDSIDDESLTKLNDLMFPHVYVTTILRAPQEERSELAEELGRARISGFGPVKSLLGLIREIREVSVSGADVNELERCVRITVNAFVRHRAQVQRQGVAIRAMVDDEEIVSSSGISLNEGITELLSRKVQATLPDEFAVPADAADHYPMEVALAEKLVSLCGERTVFRAYLAEGEEDYEAFVQAVDEALGGGAYATIIKLSDEGRWRDVFRYISTMQSRREGNNGTN